MCISPRVEATHHSHERTERFSFGEEEAAVAAMYEPPVQHSEQSHSQRVGSVAAPTGVPTAVPTGVSLTTARALQGAAAARVEPRAGFVPIAVARASASSEHPFGGREAAHLIDGSGLYLDGAGRRLGVLCNESGDLGCYGRCWASDAEADYDAQWVQFDFGRPRYVDMIHLHAFNSYHARSHLRSLASAEVQIPSSTRRGEWRTVGRLVDLPPPPRTEGDAGIHIRRAGVPSYFVPAAYRRGAAHLSAAWLGFEASAVRLARLQHHGPDGYGASFGLCEAAFFEEDPVRNRHPMAP